MGQYKSKGYFYDLLSKQNNISMGCTKIAIYIVAESLTKLASFILKKHQLDNSNENIKKLCNGELCNICEVDFCQHTKKILKNIDDICKLTDEKEILQQTCSLLISLDGLWKAILNDVIEVAYEQNSTIEQYKKKRSKEMNNKRHMYKRMLQSYVVELYKEAKDKNDHLTQYSFAMNEKNINKIIQKAKEIKEEYNLSSNLINEETIERNVYSWLRIYFSKSPKDEYC